MDYSQLPQYTGEAVTGLENVADQAAIVVDEQHVGGIPVQIETANTKLDTMQAGLDVMTSKVYTVEVVPEVKTQQAKDAFTKFVLEVMKSQGINIK